MKFRVRNEKVGFVGSEWFLKSDGVLCEKRQIVEYLFVEKKLKPEFLVGKDSLGNDVYENDVLMSETTTYTAGFNMDMGAYLEWENGSRIPFKQCVEKLVLRERA